MNNYITELWANGTQLDLFDDEPIQISNNVTGLFDIDKLPSDFTRQITIPGTKTNNAFFQHYYKIDVAAPFLFTQESKVECYIDVIGYLLVQGYIQLNNVNVLKNEIVSYDITLFGSLSNFSTDLRKNNLTDISALSAYNHTASYQNITDSWNGNLFGGDIVYPLIDYGKGYTFSSATPVGGFGIDDEERAVYVKDFKPAIRVKAVVDKIFEEFGYTYTSSFFNQPMWNNIYMVCNYGGQYPKFSEIDIDTEGLIEIRPTSGSTTDTVLTSTYQQLVWDTVISDPSYAMLPNSTYVLPVTGPAGGILKLNLHITGSGTGNLGYPDIDFALASEAWPTNPNAYSPVNIDEINRFLRETYSQLDKIGEKTYTIEQRWFRNLLVAGEKRLLMRVNNTASGNFTVTVGKGGNTESYFSVDELGTIADGKIMNIPINMPNGESGITCLDFIKSLQKKYNLIIQPSKLNPNEVEIETFNNWYRSGNIIDITSFVDENKPITVTPANVLAVNELEFTDKEGRDFLARQFVEANNRTFGKTFYKDNENQFSQGKLEIVTEFANSPLRYIDGSGDDSGSIVLPPTNSAIQILYSNDINQLCSNIGTQRAVYISANRNYLELGDILYTDQYLTTPLFGQKYVKEFLLPTEPWELQTTNAQIISSISCRD